MTVQKKRRHLQVPEEQKRADCRRKEYQGIDYIQPFKDACEKIAIDNYTIKKAIEGKFSVVKFYDLVDNNEDCAKLYARAIRVRAENLAEEIVQIADDSSEDEVIDPVSGKIKINYENIQRSRLRVDARKWCAAKLLPNKYGDKLDVTSNGKEIKETTPQIAVVIDGKDIKLE